MFPVVLKTVICASLVICIQHLLRRGRTHLRRKSSSQSFILLQSTTSNHKFQDRAKRLPSATKPYSTCSTLRRATSCRKSRPKSCEHRLEISTILPGVSLFYSGHSFQVQSELAFSQGVSPLAYQREWDGSIAEDINARARPVYIFRSRNLGALQERNRHPV